MSATRDRGAGKYSSLSYVVFGKGTGFPAVFSLSDATDGRGFKIDTVNPYDSAGVVSSAGDVNGDGFSDLILGAPNAAGNSGASYVVFGKGTAFPDVFNTTTLNGTNGFRIGGASSEDFSGSSVSFAGDVNGDGFGDVIVGAPFAEGNNTIPGAAYVIYGKQSGFTSNINVAALDGTNGVRMEGFSRLSRAGQSVSGAGDVNGTDWTMW